MTVHQADSVVDGTGLLCPAPIIALARAIDAVPVGGIVRLMADDPAAVTDVPAWCALRRHELLSSGPAPADGTLARAYRVRRSH